MIRRILLIGALVAAAGSVALAPQAGAQNYGGCNATVSDTTPNPGQAVTVSGSGADADATVTASVGATEIGSGTADADGEFSFSATVPTTASGSTTVTVDCGGGDGVDSVTLTVGSGLLPATGSNDTLPLTKVALATLALGGIVLVGARLRSRSVSASL